MAEPRWAVGVDVGGTRLSVGLVSEHGEIAARRDRETPRAQGAEASLESLHEMVAGVLEEAAGRSVCGLGLGFGGPVDFAAQQVRWSHHAAGWAGLSPARMLAEPFGLRGILENDANAGGLAEALYGAGQDADTVLYVNIGTGVGGAVILDGRIHHGANGNAGEFGHMVMDPDGPPCPCGKRGCVEALCSGDALGRMGREDAALTPWDGIATDRITGKVVGERAAVDDPAALRVLDSSTRWMGQALAAAANLLDPAVIVLGGGVPEMGPLYLDRVRGAFSRFAMALPAERTPIRPATGGHDAGFIGAAAVLFTSSNA